MFLRYKVEIYNNVIIRVQVFSYIIEFQGVMSSMLYFEINFKQVHYTCICITVRILSRSLILTLYFQ